MLHKPRYCFTDPHTLVLLHLPLARTTLRKDRKARYILKCKLLCKSKNILTNLWNQKNINKISLLIATIILLLLEAVKSSKCINLLLNILQTATSSFARHISGSPITPDRNIGILSTKEEKEKMVNHSKTL